jgi:hypothetical protein
LDLLENAVCWCNKRGCREFVHPEKRKVREALLQGSANDPCGCWRGGAEQRLFATAIDSEDGTRENRARALDEFVERCASLGPRAAAQEATEVATLFGERLPARAACGAGLSWWAR